MYPSYAHQSNRPSSTYRAPGVAGAGGGGGGYPGQAGYAVAPTAGAAGSYGAQRSGYDQTYQTAASQQGQYASKCVVDVGGAVRTLLWGTRESLSFARGRL